MPVSKKKTVVTEKKINDVKTPIIELPEREIMDVIQEPLEKSIAEKFVKNQLKILDEQTKRVELPEKYTMQQPMIKTDVIKEIVVSKQKVTITKFHPFAKLEKNKYGYDLYLPSDVELAQNQVKNVPLYIKISLPDFICGLISLDEKAAEDGIQMTNSPYLIVGEREISLNLFTVENWRLYKREQNRIIARLTFHKLDNPENYNIIEEKK